MQKTELKYLPPLPRWHGHFSYQSLLMGFYMVLPILKSTRHNIIINTYYVLVPLELELSEVVNSIMPKA